MPESLTPFEGENLASYEALKTAIALADGFTLIFAVTNTEAGAQEVMRRLWRDGVRYQKAWLRDPERPLVDQVVESVRTKQPVMVLGLEGLTTVGEQMGRSLRNLNWTRPQWTARLPQTIVFWVTADMEADLAREAPDLWRFRSLRVEFTFGRLPVETRALELRKRLRSLKLVPRIRLRTLIELFNLTRDQRPLEEAAKIVGGHPELARPGELEYLRRLRLPARDDASVQWLGPLPRLQSIELKFTFDFDEDIAHLIETSKPESLRRGVFYDVGFGLLTIKALSSLPRFTDLIWSSETKHDFRQQPLDKLKALRSLYLYMPKMNDGDLKCLSEMRHLSALTLSMTEVSDEGIAWLPSLKRLWHLAIDNSRMTSQALSSITQLKELRNLYLAANNISDINLPLLTNLPRIQRIDLSATDVTEEGVLKLRALFAAQHRKVEVLCTKAQ